MRRVVVVGAGPAGLAACRAAAAAGAEVLLIDAGARRGGQYHRQDSLSGHDAQVLPPGVEHLAQTVVWAIEPVRDSATTTDSDVRPPAARLLGRGGGVHGAFGGWGQLAAGGQRLHLLTGQADGPQRRGRTVETSALVLATGAYDRVLPFPGWDLPGVYTAGAAQALAKGQGVAVGRRVLVAGTGPFLLPVTRELLRVGASVPAVLEANGPAWHTGLFAGLGKSAELAGYLRVLGRHRVPYRIRTAVIAAHGSRRVEAVTVAKLDSQWRIRPGTERRVDVDAVCVGYGFTPQLELALAAGCALRAGFVAVDTTQRTSVPGVFAAGELTGIGGADLAAAEGEVAGAAAASAATVPHRALRRVRSLRRFAAALDAMYPIRSGWRDWLTDDTLVCRCEEVTRGALRAAAPGSRALRLTSRAGLGLCQGRVCGAAVADLTGLPADAFGRRPIAAPVRLGELAHEESE